MCGCGNKGAKNILSNQKTFLKQNISSPPPKNFITEMISLENKMKESIATKANENIKISENIKKRKSFL